MMRRLSGAGDDAMTEAEWLRLTDGSPNDSPNALLWTMREGESDRKVRLLVCACCRAFWSLLTDERSRRAIEVCEMYADGIVNLDELKRVRMAAYQAMHDSPRQIEQEPTMGEIAFKATASNARAIRFAFS